MSKNTVTVKVTLPAVDIGAGRDAYYELMSVIEEYGITVEDCNVLWRNHLAIAAFLLGKHGKLPSDIDEAGHMFNGQV